MYEIFNLESYEEVTHPIKMCYLIDSNLKYIDIINDINPIGIIRYDNNNNRIDIHIHDGIFTGCLEYMPPVDKINPKRILCTKFDNDFLVHRVIDCNGNVWSMIINDYIPETDGKSIEFYKGDELYNGNVDLFNAILNGDITDLIEVRYTSLNPQWFGGSSI